jgi:hypothetical protein
MIADRMPNFDSRYDVNKPLGPEPTIKTGILAGGGVLNRHPSVGSDEKTLLAIVH